MTLFDEPLPPAVDMHCHLADAGGYRTVVPGSLVLAVTNDPAAWQAMARTSKTGGPVVWALGLHPCEQDEDDDRLDVLIEALPNASAVGEIGLDYSFRSSASPASQRRILNAILTRQATKERIVTLHSVQATSDIVQALEDYQLPGAVVHWFLGTTNEVDRLMDAGTYFSVNSAMLRSKRGMATLSEMPPNRVLVETDAPHVKRGATALSAGQVEPVERGLAKIWRISPEETRRRLWQNFQALNSRVSVPLFESLQ